MKHVSLSDGEGPRVIKLLQRVQDTGAFLRMAAIELRRMAEQSPDIGVELRTVAQKLDLEAEDLARGGTEWP